MTDNFNICNNPMVGFEEKKTSSEFKSNITSYIWTIDKFSEYTERQCWDKNLISTSPSGNPLKWQLKIYPNGDNEEAKNHVSINIRLIDTSAVLGLSGAAEFYIRDSDGNASMPKISPHNKLINNAICFNSTIERSALLGEANKLLPGDQLTIGCKINIAEEMVPTRQALSLDMSAMYEKSVFTDCRIIAGDGKAFKVHKCILATRSKVFEVVGRQEGDLKIEDIKSEVLEQMLLFIYSGTAPKLAEMAEELLAAADKYQLNQLKVLCEHEFAKSMNIGNVCELLILANRHSAEYLKAKAIEYFQEHKKEVIKLDGWKMLIKGNDAKLIGDLVMGSTAGK